MLSKSLNRWRLLMSQKNCRFVERFKMFTRVPKRNASNYVYTKRCYVKFTLTFQTYVRTYLPM